MDFEHDSRTIANDPDEISGWRIALDTAWASMGSAFSRRDDFVNFAKCFSSPEQFSAFIPLDENANQIEEFLRAVDASDYTMKEWVRSLGVLEDWLKSKNRDLNMEQCIGYMACCAEVASVSAPLLSLEEVTIEMIANHGIE